MSQQVIEQPSVDTNLAVYEEADIAIRQLEKFEKTCPSQAETTALRSTRPATTLPTTGTHR